MPPDLGNEEPPECRRRKQPHGLGKPNRGPDVSAVARRGPYAGPMHLYELTEPQELTDPVLIVAFDGWVNAGSAGTGAAEHLAGGGVVIARFDPDELYDYRAARPTAEFESGVLASIDWPELTIRHRVAEGRDLLVLTGVEPNWRWQRLGGEIADLAVQLGVAEHLSLGGIPWATPHTHLTSIIETASQPELLEDDSDHPEGTLHAPASATSAVESYVAARGVPTRGFWARVPHYVGAAYVPATVALVERVLAHLEITLPYGTLLDDAASQRRRLDELVAEQPEAQDVVERLEQLAVEDTPSGEDLATEIERFLQQQPPGLDPFGDDGEPSGPPGE